MIKLLYTLAGQSLQVYSKRNVLRWYTCVGCLSLCLMSGLAASPSVAAEPATADPVGWPRVWPAAGGQPLEFLSDAKVEVTTERGSVQVAEPFWVSIRVLHARDQQVRFPELTQWGDFVVLQVEVQPSVPSGEQRVTTCRVELESWSAGEHPLPSLSLELLESKESGLESAKASATGVVLTTPVMKVQVDSARSAEEPLETLEALADVRDVPAASPESVSYWRDPKVWVVGCGGVLGLALLVAWWLRRSPEHEAQLSEWADARLSALQEGQEGTHVLSEAERWGRASQVVRDYLSLRFGLTASVGTADEIMQQLQQQGWAKEFLSPLEAWLQQAELVSFAGVPMESDAWLSMVKEARRLIRKAEALHPLLDPQNDTSMRPAITHVVEGGE